MEKVIEIYNYIQPALFFVLTGLVVFLAIIFRKKWFVYGSFLFKIVSNVLSNHGFKVPKEFTNIQKEVDSILDDLSKFDLGDDYYKVKSEVRKLIKEDLEATVEEYLKTIEGDPDSNELIGFSDDLYKAAFYAFLEDAFDHIFDFAWEKSGRELPLSG